MKIEKIRASSSTIYTEQYPQKRQDSAQQSTLVLLGDIAACLMSGGVDIGTIWDGIWGKKVHTTIFLFVASVLMYYYMSGCSEKVYMHWYECKAELETSE